jgi:hypothetical protein
MNYPRQMQKWTTIFITPVASNALTQLRIHRRTLYKAWAACKMVRVSRRTQNPPNQNLLTRRVDDTGIRFLF